MAPQHVLLTLPSKEWQADAARIYQITPAHTSTKAASRKKAGLCYIADHLCIITVAEPGDPWGNCIDQTKIDKGKSWKTLENHGHPFYAPRAPFYRPQILGFHSISPVDP